MNWSDLESTQPRLAAVARARLIDPGVVLVATIRGDGSPRLSPVEPFLLGGELLLSMLWGSLKARDLGRDPRLLVHGIVTSRDGGDGELKVRGRALPEGDPTLQRRYADAVSAALGWSPEVGRFHLFRVDIEDVTFLRYDDTTGDQFLVRWPAGVETVRRGTGATTLGPPEPHQDLLDR